MMEASLPVVFLFLMGLSMLIYVILDGYDLGVGMLTILADEQHYRDAMIASVGPFWDANETWLVLGVGILLIAFPKAHGIVLSSLYVPVTIMLIGLILRGVAFDFRVKLKDQYRLFWEKMFFIGSLVASLAQGWMLGAYVTGLNFGTTQVLFSVLIALSLPALYIMLGATWLMIKTEGGLFEKSMNWARLAWLPMGIGLFIVSIATPVVSPDIAKKWFSLPNAIGILPIPISCIIAYLTIFFLLRKPHLIRRGYVWLVFAGLVFICFMACVGLAFSLFPDVIMDKMTVWEAASHVESLKIILIGVIITLPVILAYNLYIHKLFYGKLTKLSYE